MVTLKTMDSSYKISFSMGYDIYDRNSKMNSDDFFNHIDTLMYNNKKSRSWIRGLDN